MWGAAGWAAGITGLLVAMPFAARGRLPERLATHWGGGSGAPDGSMPLWAAAVFPAAVWAALVLGVALTRRWSGPGAGAALASGGVLLAGAQAAVVRANLDRDDWRQAGPVTVWVVAVVAVAALAGAAGVLLARRGADPAPAPVPGAPGLEVPGGQRLVWLARTTNPWLQLLSAVLGVAALGGVLAGLGGLIGAQWPAAAVLGLTSLVVLGCSSVQARVSGKGLEVAFGPLGRPVRRWAAADIEAAWTEDRTPARAGGWGYRINGLGTTVMLRGGPCLVIRAKGRDFAVSVDDAERGAALLNSLLSKAG
ncbi:DUF1648 domain-containing protein [Streptomyces sp. NBC_00249]|nr:DUF1648 domain-containing protein [Streptomyces sp. NBC_00249]